MITCKELAELLMAYFDGELSQEHCDTICHHIHCCPPCLHFMETYRITVHICRDLPQTPPPAHLLDKLRAASQEKGEQATG